MNRENIEFLADNFVYYTATPGQQQLYRKAKHLGKSIEKGYRLTKKFLENNPPRYGKNRFRTPLKPNNPFNKTKSTMPRYRKKRKVTYRRRSYKRRSRMSRYKKTFTRAIGYKRSRKKRSPQKRLSSFLATSITSIHQNPEYRGATMFPNVRRVVLTTKKTVEIKGLSGGAHSLLTLHPNDVNNPFFDSNVTQAPGHDDLGLIYKRAVCTYFKVVFRIRNDASAITYPVLCYAFLSKDSVSFTMTDRTECKDLKLPGVRIRRTDIDALIAQASRWNSIKGDPRHFGTANLASTSEDLTQNTTTGQPTIKVACKFAFFRDDGLDCSAPLEEDHTLLMDITVTQQVFYFSRHNLLDT